ncbi:MAG: hypothetical protein Q7J65_02295 [Candidatus Marinimicrobia bacterium]|nr:hypothetical protein [Candidatus Neomarinimicrobiota bacterium]
MRIAGNILEHSTLEEGYDFFVTDRWKKKYHFKISYFPVPVGFLSEAVEVVTGKRKEPYMFAVLSDFDSDLEQAELMLKAKIKRGVNRRHLVQDGKRLRISDSQVVRGRIEWNDDLSDTRFDRILVVDGRKITMEMLYDLLEEYEGWNFKLSIHDRTEDCD